MKTKASFLSLVWFIYTLQNEWKHWKCEANLHFKANLKEQNHGLPELSNFYSVAMKYPNGG